MALPAYALTTRATVLDELDLEDDGGKVAARVERYIRAASSLVALIIGNGTVVQLHEAAVTERVAGRDHPTLMLSTRPLVSIQSITIDGVVVDTTEYEIDNAAAGFVHRIGGTWPSEMLAAAGVVTAAVPGTERRNITVAYTAGWKTPAQGGTQTLPQAIEDATVELVTSRWKRRGQDLRISGQNFSGSSYTYAGVPVPAEVMAALGPFIRIASA